MKHWILISKCLDNTNKIVGKIAKWSVLGMIIIGVWNVLGRYIGVAIGFNLSSNRLIEAQWYFFDLIFLLGLGWTLQYNGHVRVDVLQKLWSERQKEKIELLGTLLLLLPFSLGVLIISINPTIASWSIYELSPDPNGLPRYLIKTLIPLAFGLLSLQGISQAIKIVAELKKNPLKSSNISRR